MAQVMAASLAAAACAVPRQRARCAAAPKAVSAGAAVRHQFSSRSGPAARGPARSSRCQSGLRVAALYGSDWATPKDSYLTLVGCRGA